MQGRGKVNRWMGGRRKGEGRCCWRREEKDPCALSICEIRATKQPRGIFDPDSADIPRGSKIGYIYIRFQLYLLLILQLMDTELNSYHGL